MYTCTFTCIILQIYDSLHTPQHGGIFYFSVDSQELCDLVKSASPIAVVAARMDILTSELKGLFKQMLKLFGRVSVLSLSLSLSVLSLPPSLTQCVCSMPAYLLYLYTYLCTCNYLSIYLSIYLMLLFL